VPTRTAAGTRAGTTMTWLLFWTPTVPGGPGAAVPGARRCGGRAPGAAPAPTHDFGFGLCLVTAWAEPDGLTRAEPLGLEPGV
jgi:hypothetical protein